MKSLRRRAFLHASRHLPSALAPAALSALSALGALTTLTAPAGAQAPLFRTPLIAVDSDPLDVAVADFNSDLHLDLASANTGTDTVTILLGDGLGAFTALQTKTVPDVTRYVVAGDMDGDGDIDLVLASTQADRVSLLRNHGDGTFDNAVNTVSPNGPDGIALGDIDEDGDLDVVASNYGPGGLTLHVNTGGTLSAAVTVSGANNSVRVQLLDVNLDGHLDAACLSADGVDIYHGDGAGGFDGPVVLAGGLGPSSLGYGDLNGDPWPDFAVAHTLLQTLEVHLSDGAGGFLPLKSFFAVASPRAVRVADVDEDGAGDIVVNGSSELGVVYGNGNGGAKALATFEAANENPVMTCIDVDADGALDVVSATQLASAISVVFGDGVGGFATATGLPAFGSTDILPGDVDLDGDIDLVALRASGVATPLLNDGEGGYTAGPESPLAHSPATGALCDVDGDGVPDLLGASSLGFLTIQIGNGSGAFGPATSVPNGSYPAALAAGDVDGDGDADVVIGNSAAVANTAQLFRNDGSGHFSGPEALPSGTRAVALHLVDVDGDSDLDLAYVNRLGSAASMVSVMRNDGTGVFAAPVSQVLADASELDAGDLDGDGDRDLAVLAGQSHKLALLLNDGSGNFSAPAVQATPEYPDKVAIADADCDGRADVVASGLGIDGVSIHLGDGAGHVAAAQSFTTGKSAQRLVAADLDADGHLDLVTAHIATVNILFGASESGWCGLGGGLAGSHGIPQLAGTGTLEALTPVTLTLSAALENSSAALVLGLARLDAPFKGGVLVPVPSVLVAGLPTGPAGTLVLASTMPAGLPAGTHLYLQELVLDAAAPHGIAISTALQGVTP
jgi:hypothetical protein